MSNVPEKLMQLFNTGSVYKTSNLREVYAENAVFEDPVIRVEGLDNISHYLKHLYSRVIECQFDYNNLIVAQQQAAISWAMTFRHQSLNKGKPIKVNGCSIVTYNEKILFHRDYFDVGEMLYEYLPLLGPATKYVKRRMH